MVDTQSEREYHTLLAGLEKVRKAWAERKGPELAADLAARCRKALSRAGELLKADLEPHDQARAKIKAHWLPVTDGFAQMAEVCRGFLEEHLRSQSESSQTERQQWVSRREELVEKGEALEREAKNEPDPEKREELLRQAGECWREHRRLGREAPEGPKTPAGVHTRKAYEWELVDIDALPAEYRKTVPDAEAIKNALKRGLREIPGLRIDVRDKPVVKG